MHISTPVLWPSPLISQHLHFQFPITSLLKIFVRSRCDWKKKCREGSRQHGYWLAKYKQHMDTCDWPKNLFMDSAISSKCTAHGNVCGWFNRTAHGSYHRTCDWLFDLFVVPVNGQYAWFVDPCDCSIWTVLIGLLWKLHEPRMKGPMWQVYRFIIPGKNLFHLFEIISRIPNSIETSPWGI